MLTPLAVDPGHPFPYISNLSLNLVVEVMDPVTSERRIARVKVPPVLPRFVVMADGERFVALEQVIAAHLDTLFPGMVIGAHETFRVTRNADLAVEEDEADDLLVAVEMELQPPALRAGRAPRARGRRQPGRAATCSSPSSRSRPTTCTRSRRRSTSPACGPSTRSTARISTRRRGRR